MDHTLALPLSEPSQVGEARRQATRLAAAAGLGGEAAGRAALVATELAQNLVRHAKGGELLLRATREPAGLELISIDRGPGIPDVERATRDGFSTGGTPGNGLGAVLRLSARFDIYSAPSGTALLSRVLAAPHGLADGPASPYPPGDEVLIGAVCAPKRGEEVPGDAYAVRRAGGRLKLLVADGLGHGALAAKAARIAVERFLGAPEAAGPEALLAAMNEALRGSRGAAAAVLDAELETGAVRYAGVGNIAAALWPLEGKPAHLVSYNGTLGYEAPRIREMQYRWPEGATLVMHSDGLASSLRLAAPALAARHPALVAALLYRDFARGTDDATALVARRAP